MFHSLREGRKTMKVHSEGSPRLPGKFNLPAAGLPGKASHVYPNPAGNEIYIDVPGDLNGNVTFKVFDITGALLKTVHVHNSHEKIDTKKVKEGVYLFNLEVNNSILETGKLVIIR